MIDHHDKYVEYHRALVHQDPNVSNSDLLVTEAIDIFKDREYNRDVINILVQICADALGLNIFMSQKTLIGLKFSNTVVEIAVSLYT